jgi:hypothetical protein
MLTWKTRLRINKMWKALAENSALILSLVISIHTTYSFFKDGIAYQRQRHGLMRSLQLENEYFIVLAESLAQRTKQVVDLHVKPKPGEFYPSPAEEKDSLPEESEPAVRWLSARLDHLIALPPPVDFEKLGGMLNRRQIDTLVQFVADRRTYTQVLATRAIDLKAFPQREVYSSAFMLLQRSMFRRCETGLKPLENRSELARRGGRTVIAEAVKLPCDLCRDGRRQTRCLARYGLPQPSPPTSVPASAPAARYEDDFGGREAQPPPGALAARGERRPTPGRGG